MKVLKFVGYDKQTKDFLELKEDEMVFYNRRLGLFRDFYSNHVVRLQFTGVRDKFGREVYEGHIVRIDGLNYMCKVVPSYGGWYLVDKDGVLRKGLFEIREEEFEIVGNIFENPELLR